MPKKNQESKKFVDLFKSEKKEAKKEELREPTLEEQLQEVEVKLAANNEEAELVRGQLDKVRQNIANDFQFLENEIARMRRDYSGTTKGFIDKLLKMRHPSSEHRQQTAKKLEANLSVLKHEKQSLMKRAEHARKLISETEDRECAGEIIDTFESLIDHLKESYVVWQKLKDLLPQIDRSTLVYHIGTTYKKPGVYSHILTSRLKVEHLNNLGMADFMEACMEMTMDTEDGKPLISVDYAELNSRKKHWLDDAFVEGDEPSIVRKAQL